MTDLKIDSKTGQIAVSQLAYPLNQVVAEVARRIIAIAAPQQILLFGSAARGGFGPDSDLDFLVIVHAPTHRRHLEQQIYANLHGVGAPVDVVVATDEDIARSGDQIGTIYRPALREGIIIYENWISLKRIPWLP